jgi:hypothetical protein
MGREGREIVDPVAEPRPGLEWQIGHHAIDPVLRSQTDELIERLGPLGPWEKPFTGRE